jgi:hypothetical protein
VMLLVPVVAIIAPLMYARSRASSMKGHA